MDNKNQIEDRIEETEKYIDELEDQLCGYEDLVAKKSYLISKITDGQAELASMKTEQKDTLNELIHKIKELSCKNNIQEENLLGFQEENNDLQCENEQILIKLDELQIDIEKLEDCSLNLYENNKILKTKLSEAMQITNKLQDRLQIAQSELQDKEQNIICIQNTMAKTITQITALEKKINTEQVRSECLQSLICQLKMKSEQTCKTMQAEMTKTRCEFDKKSAELCMLKQKLKEKQDELCEFKNRSIQLEEELELYKECHCQEKCKIDKEIGELRAELKSIASNFKLINSKLCDAQVENTKLKCQIKDQNDSIKHLEPTKETLQQELKKIKEATDSMIEIIATQRKNHENDIQIINKKLELKKQEECELKELSKKQKEQLYKF